MSLRRWLRPALPALLLLLATPAAQAGSSAVARDPRAAALAALKADAGHLRARLRAAGKPVLTLDLSDPVQHRFLLQRLAAAGKTAKTSPRLFAEIEKLRRRQLQAGAARTAATALTLTTEREPVHLISDLVEQDGQVIGRAHSTVEDGSFYTYLDALLWEGPEEEMSPIGDLGIDEQFNQGTEVFATAIAALTSTVDLCRASDSIKCEMRYSDGVLDCTYAVEKSCARATQWTLTAPHERTEAQNNLITVCLDRTWQHGYDCDYELTNTQGRIKLPVAGEVRYNRPIKRAANGKPEGTVVLTLSLAQSGGGCPTAERQIDLSGTGVTTQIVANGTGEKLIWSIDPADFGDRCFQNQADVNLFASVSVKLQDGTKLVPVTSLWSPLTDASHLLPIEFAWSCLAAGTEVRLADGSARAIETVAVHQPVLSRLTQPAMTAGNAGLASLPEALLTTVDRSVGVERIPMVRIEDELGHSLLLTGGHPVITVRGPVLARELRAGDRVLTERGPSRLARVERETYAGNVYNLKLGTADELAAHPDAQATFFANGILVGDGRLQDLWQDRADRRPTIARIPAAWRQDYRHRTDAATGR